MNYPSISGSSGTGRVECDHPYKKQVLSVPGSKRIFPTGLDACNCINIIGGKLVGYNTDVTGFEKSL